MCDYDSHPQDICGHKMISSALLRNIDKVYNKRKEDGWCVGDNGTLDMVNG